MACKKAAPDTKRSRLPNTNKVTKTTTSTKAAKTQRKLKKVSHSTKPLPKEINLEWCQTQLTRLFERCPRGGFLKLQDASALFEGQLSKNLTIIFQEKNYVVASCNYCNQCDKLATECASKKIHKRNRLQIVKNIRVRVIPTRRPLPIIAQSTQTVEHDVNKQVQIKKEHVRINKEQPQIKDTRMQIKEEKPGIKNEAKKEHNELIDASPCVMTDLSCMYDTNSFKLPYFSILDGHDLSDDFLPSNSIPSHLFVGLDLLLGNLADSF